MTRLLLVAAALAILVLAGVAAASMPLCRTSDSAIPDGESTNWAATVQQYAVRAARSHPMRW